MNNTTTKINPETLSDDELITYAKTFSYIDNSLVYNLVKFAKTEEVKKEIKSIADQLYRDEEYYADNY